MVAKPGTDALVEGRGIGVRHGRHTILQGIDIAVHAGEIVTIIGPNGAGKTILVRTLLGLVRPTAGTVERRAGAVVGYLPQRFVIDPVLPLTVRRLMSLTRRAGREAALAALGEVGAAHLIDHAAQDLSGGELQRVMLARALLGDPDLLVLDEPIQGVDVTGQAELYALIARIRDRRGCGILLVSHDLHVVMASTDRVVCINQHLCCAGRPESVSRDPAYLALFGPEAAGRLAVYTHAHDHHHGLHGEVIHDHADHGHERPAARGGTRE
ncbi:MAG: ATP-binding cassette domain-containing protein [Alphaproteobacteria bacterium]